MSDESEKDWIPNSVPKDRRKVLLQVQSHLDGVLAHLRRVTWEAKLDSIINLGHLAHGFFASEDAVNATLDQMLETQESRVVLAQLAQVGLAAVFGIPIPNAEPEDGTEKDHS